MHRSTQSGSSSQIDMSMQSDLRISWDTVEYLESDLKKAWKTVEQLQSENQDLTAKVKRLTARVEELTIDKSECHTRLEKLCEERKADVQLIATQGSILKKIRAVLLQELQCPITHVPFVQAVVAADGHTYEKNAIEKWLQNSDASPLTRQHMGRKDIFSNRLVRRISHSLHKILPSVGFASDVDALFAAFIRRDREACRKILVRGELEINTQIDEAVSEEIVAPSEGTFRRHRFQGTTALHVAAWLEWDDVCRLILLMPGFSGHGDKNIYGSTALSMCTPGHPTYAALRQYGVG